MRVLFLFLLIKILMESRKNLVEQTPLKKFQTRSKKKPPLANKKKIFVNQWLRRTGFSLQLLLFDNFYLVIYFLFFIFLNKKQSYGLLKLLITLQSNRILQTLKKLSFIKNFFFFNNLYNYLLFKLTAQWNQFILKNFSKRFFKLINFNLITSSSLFLVYLRKILNFFFTHKALKLLFFVTDHLNRWLTKVVKPFIFKENFFFTIVSKYPRYFQRFHWQFSNKVRYFFSQMLLWIYFIFDKMTLVYWLAFFFFWLRNFIFLLFGLNWLWLNGKDDIFKAFEYSRNITISFNNNLLLQGFHALDYDTAFFKIFNKVKSISSDFNFAYYPKNSLEDWDVFSNFYFFQDKGLHFFLKMQQDVLSFNTFIDRFFNKIAHDTIGFSSSFFPFFLDFQMVKPNLKNFWFLDSFQDQRNFLFFFKKMVTPFFYLKKNKILPVPSSSYYFLESPTFQDPSVAAVEPLDPLFSSKIFFYLKRFFFERFFLFFLDKFLFFSFYFFQHFFLHNFFSKFVKLLGLCFFKFLHFFFFKVQASQARFIFVYFCLFLKNFFRQEGPTSVASGLFFDLLPMNSWNITAPSNAPSMSSSNFFLNSILKSFSFFQSNKFKGISSNSSNFLIKISKKILFWEIFIKKYFFFFLKKKSTFDKITTKMPAITYFSSLRLKRLRSLLFSFLPLEETQAFRLKARKTLADFSMEDFLAFDLFSLNSFFLNSFSSFDQSPLPLIFWNHFKLTFLSFAQAKSFFFLQKLCLKSLKNFMHFFFLLQNQLVGNYLGFFKEASYNFLKAAFLLKKFKAPGSLKKKLFNVFAPSFSFFHNRSLSLSSSVSCKNFLFLLHSSLKLPLFFFNMLAKDGKKLFSMDSLAHSFPFFNDPNMSINSFQVQRFFTKRFFLTKISFMKFIKKHHSFNGTFFFNKFFSVKASYFFFSFSYFFFKKHLAKGFLPQKFTFFKRWSFSKIFDKNKNFYFIAGSKALSNPLSNSLSNSLANYKFQKFLRLLNALKSKKALLARFFFRQKKNYRKVFFSNKSYHSLYRSNGFSKGSFLENFPKNFFDRRSSYNYKSFGLVFNSFFLQALKNKFGNFIFSFKATLGLNKPVSKQGLIKNFFSYDYVFFKNFFYNFSLKKFLHFFVVPFSKKAPLSFFMHFFFQTFSKKIFFRKSPLSLAAMPFLNFFFSSFPLLKKSRSYFFVLNFFSLLKIGFFGDFFLLSKSFFYFDFFSPSLFFRDLFFFKFFSVKFSFLAVPFKKNSKPLKEPGSSKDMNSRNFPFPKFNCFIFKSKGFLFFLRKYEVLLFLDNVFIWYFCFRNRIIKKRLIFGSSRVFFFKPFFFDKGLKKNFSFFSLLKSLPQWTMLAKGFNFLYHKRLVKQKSLFLSFYFFNNSLVLFFDNFFWSLVSFKQLVFFFRTPLQTNPFQFFLLKKNCFFVPFFFKERNLNFFFSLPSFMQKISWKISMNFLQPPQGSYLAPHKFFFFTYSKPFFFKKRFASNFSLPFLNKRIFFLKKILNPFFKESFNPLLCLRFSRSLKFSELSPFKRRHFYFFQHWKTRNPLWDPSAKVFVPSKNRKLLVLESRESRGLYSKARKNFHSFRLDPYTFFLHYFYNYKFSLHKNNLTFFRYFNNLLQKFDLQVQRDFFFSFLRFFWKNGRKYWYIKVSNDFYVWDFGRKTWFFYKKSPDVNFYFTPRVLSLQNSIFLSRVHFKIFNSSIFNQFFSFSFIKRWTSWKFLYRMHDFMAQLSIQRNVIKQGLSLNYPGITLANSFFGTAFALNNRSFYSFNNLLLKSLLYNIKSIFFFNVHTVFSLEAISNSFAHKTFFSLLSFFPLFSKSIFNVFTHFAGFTQSFFLFSSFSFFVRSSVHGFFWNFLSFINPFIKMKKHSLAFKVKSLDSHFCNFLFLDFKEKFVYAKFYKAHLNSLWRISRHR